MQNRVFNQYLNDCKKSSSLLKWLKNQDTSVFREAAKAYDQAGVYPNDLVHAIIQQPVYTKYLTGQHQFQSRLEYYEFMRELATLFPSLASLIAIQTDYILYSLSRFANDKFKSQYLEPTLDGQLIGAFASYEHETITQLDRMKTTAEEQADGYVITGIKNMVSIADVADFFIVVAKCHTGDLGLFIVDKDTEGLTIGELTEVGGRQAFPVFPVILDNVEVPKEKRILGALSGLEMLKEIRKQLKKSITVIAYGTASGVLEMGESYLRQDRNLGRPLIASRTIQEDLSSLYMEMSVLKPNIHQMIMENVNTDIELAILKYKSCALAVNMSEKLLHLSAGSGAKDQAEFARYYRDAQMLTDFGGSPATQMKIISQKWEVFPNIT